MRILFTILTVIGILLLIILILAAFCLFYPVSYRIRGEAEDEVSLLGRFWWLFGMLWFEFALKGFEPEMRFGILWFQRSFGGKETEEEASRTGNKRTAHEKLNLGASGQERPAGRLEERSAAGEKPDAAKMAAQGKKPDAAKMDALEKKEDTREAVAGGKKNKRNKRIRPKARAKPGRGASRLKRAKDFKSKGVGRVRAWKGSYARLKAEVMDEKNRKAIRHIWEEITYIVTRLKPKYIDGGFDFSTGDPALTGLLTGALSMLPVMYQYNACICPDFVSDDPYIRGAVSCGGKISLYHGLVCLLRLVRDKNTIQLIQKFR